MQKPTLAGRLVRTTEDPSELFIVTGTAFDVNLGKDVAHVRRIRPLPPVYAEPIPVSDLVEAVGPEFWKEREGLAMLLSRALQGALESPGAMLFAKTEFEEYQFRPLLKFEGSVGRRLLIADEVGLGKTIEAGYILVEEIARGRASRALVLCPSGLKVKWQQELWRRFGLNFEIANGRRLKSALHTQGQFRIIASFDLEFSPESLDPTAYPVDLLIIDEVHNMIGRTGETVRRRLGLEISHFSRQVIGLSATPIQLAEDDLRKVLEVVLGESLPPRQFQLEITISKELNSIAAALRESGLPAHDGSIRSSVSALRNAGLDESTLAEILSLTAKAERGESPAADLWANALERMESLAPISSLMTRSRKSDVGQKRGRRIHNHPVKLGIEVIEGFQGGQVTEISESGLFQEVDGILVRHFAHVHRQQLSSCLPAMLDLMRTGMRGFRVWRRGSELLGPSDVLDVEQGDRPLGQFELPRKAIEECANVADKYGLLENDSKWDELRRILEDLAKDPTKGRKAIIFTQWVPTLQYLSQRSKGLRGVRVFATSGEDSDWKVESSLAEFRACVGPAILFTTDMLSEGVDLQVADAIVNYDFPYNPQRVEQRIGRIDRVGQKSQEVDIHNIWVQGSLDEEIIDILQRRLDIFRQALGDATDLFRIRPNNQGKVQLVWLDKRRRSTMARLGELDLFSGLVDFLDSEARSLRRLYGGGLRALSWVLVARAIILSTGGRASVEETGTSLSVGPVTDEDVELLASWAGVREAGLVKSALGAFRDERQRIDLSKDQNGDGLYVPPSHPLARVAVEVNSNSFRLGGLGEGVLRVRAKTRPYPDAKQFIVCRYELRLPAADVYDLVCWESVDKGWRKLATERQVGFREWLAKTPIAVDRVPDFILPEEAHKEIEADIEAWKEARVSAMQPLRATEHEPSQSTRTNATKGFECIGVIYSGEV